VKLAESGDPVVITRYGTPVAAIVSVVELEQVKRLRGSNAGLGALAGGWEGSAELERNVQNVRRSRSQPRRRRAG
jgi:prevent-host-death family protein